jgi:hypothetical protein
VVFEIGPRVVTAQVPQTASWSEFRVVDLGEVLFDEAGSKSVKARAKDATGWKPVNLRSVKLVRAAAQ